MRRYSELLQFPTIEERFEYLKLPGRIGQATFGYDRVFNQNFYTSKLWKDTRRKIILRDNACDLAMPGYELYDRVMIHHMNPITIDDIKSEKWEYLTDPEYLVCVSFTTHQAIHFGDASQLPQLPIERKPGDTCLWR